jgi:hypothetical protein
VAKYIKTVPIEAEQFDGSEAMIDKYGMMDVGTMNGSQHSDQIIIPTLTGGVHVLDGDWITTEKGGDHSVVDGNDNFEQMFKKLPVIPRAIANAIEEYRDKFGSAKGLLTLILDMDRPWTLDTLVTVAAMPELTIHEFINKTDVLARAWLDGYEIEDKS